MLNDKIAVANIMKQFHMMRNKKDNLYALSSATHPEDPDYEQFRYMAEDSLKAFNRYCEIHKEVIDFLREVNLV